MHKTGSNTWVLWMRAGDRALVDLHQSWGEAFARIFDAVERACR
jgi:hypothetical protein